MTRKILNIGDYQYLAELYTSEDFDINESIYSKFVMFRNFDIVNDIVNDTEILIMSKQTWEKLCNEIDNNENNVEGFERALSTVFPIQNINITHFSSLYSEFNSNLRKDLIYTKKDNGDGTYTYEYGNAIFPIYGYDDNGKFVEKDIKCNKIKLYHPLTKNHLQGIVTIDNYINNIHWYYLCNTLDNLTYNSETEIRVNNNIYSEYIEIIFPNIDDLFKLNEVTDSGKEIYNTYFNEKFNIVVSTKNDKYISRMIVDTVERYYNLEFNIVANPDIIDPPYNVDTDNQKILFYVGENNPISIVNDKYVLNNKLDIITKDTPQDLFNYINDNRSGFNIPGDDYKTTYILIPKDFEKNIIVSNLLIGSNEEDDVFSDDQLNFPLFEILCDIIYDDIVINGMRYKLMKTRPKCKSIRLYDKRFDIDNIKYFYIGPKYPIYQHNDNHFSVYDEEQSNIIRFKDVNELFDHHIDSPLYIYKYNQYRIPNEENDINDTDNIINDIYILFPQELEKEFIITNTVDVDYNGPIFESDYEIIQNDILLNSISDTDTPINTNIRYMLVKIHRNNGDQNIIRIYNISYRNNRDIDNSDQIDVESYYKISDYITLKNQYVPLSILLQPYRIVEDYDPVINDIRNVKLYIKQNISIENNYLSNPFNLIIFPYDYIDSSTGQYIYDDKLSIANTTFNVESKITVVSKLGFNEDTHKISILSEFNYPNKSIYLKNSNGDTGQAFRNAYSFLNNITSDIYDYYWADLFLIKNPDLENKYINIFDELAKDYTSDVYKYLNDKQITSYDLDNRTKIKYLVESNYDNLMDGLRDWEIEEEFQTNMDFLGFRLMIATDSQYKNLIYNETFSIEFNNLDNFAFEINKIFDNWEEYPNYLICKTIFIDRILGSILISNDVIISKEYFKYLINDNNLYCFNKLNKINNQMTEINVQKSNKTKENIVTDIVAYANNIGDLIEYSDSLDEEKISTIKNLIKDINEAKEDYDKANNTFNFISNINCIVNKYNNDEGGQLTNNSFTPKILYQPIFYRTQDLQHIKFRANLSQNIGVNLSQYMSKVETFKMIIDDQEFDEYGRNDIFVLFNIDSKVLTTLNGTYNIVNQDDQYVSSGSWSIY